MATVFDESGYDEVATTEVATMDRRWTEDCSNFKNVIEPYMKSINATNELFWPIHFVEDAKHTSGSIYILPYGNDLNVTRTFEPNCQITLQVEFFDIEYYIYSYGKQQCWDELQFLNPGTDTLSNGMENFPRCRELCDPYILDVAMPDARRFDIRFTSDNSYHFEGAKINWQCRNRDIELIYKVRDMSHEELELQMRIFPFTDEYESMVETISINRGTKGK